MRWTQLEDGTVRELQPRPLEAPERRDDPDAAGPEDDGVIEIDIVRGRLSMDLGTPEEDLNWEGPELDTYDLTRPPQALDFATDDDALGPEFDVEHILDEGGT